MQQKHVSVVSVYSPSTVDFFVLCIFGENFSAIQTQLFAARQIQSEIFASRR